LKGWIENFVIRVKNQLTWETLIQFKGSSHPGSHHNVLRLCVFSLSKAKIQLSIIEISAFSYWHTCLFSHVYSKYGMQGLLARTLHKSKTLESLTWIRVHPSYCCEQTLLYSHAVYCLYLRSLNIQHSNRSFVLSFYILTYQWFSLWYVY